MDPCRNAVGETFFLLPQSQSDSTACTLSPATSLRRSPPDPLGFMHNALCVSWGKMDEWQGAPRLHSESQTDHRRSHPPPFPAPPPETFEVAFSCVWLQEESRRKRRRSSTSLERRISFSTLFTSLDFYCDLIVIFIFLCFFLVDRLTWAFAEFLAQLWKWNNALNYFVFPQLRRRSGCRVFHSAACEHNWLWLSDEFIPSRHRHKGGRLP